MTHPNDMTAWDSISCAHGYARHATKLVPVSIGGPTPYHDYPPIPERFARRFLMNVYDWSGYGDVTGYCPAHDAVSETIDTLGVWEPAETTLVLAACMAAPGATFVDFGSQLGWFSLLAASCGLDVICYEADPANAEVMLASFAANGWKEPRVVPGRVGPDSLVLAPGSAGGHVAVAKIDVEGAEPDAVRVLWPLIDAGKIDNLLVEVSPCFHDGYPDLVALLDEAGYSVHPLPEKRPVPLRFDEFPVDLGEDLGVHGAGGLRAEVASWDQKNVWFTRDGAPWA